ncbi:hypothetical protein BHM03_00048949 [Ensete ventricosum]|uniref:Cyclic nucleotide-binding domain-containing protein n=1 Tax=Ensete ventricosum TaxID=4639 RepID=A0A426YL46_ENSVE|nr:hypothetical protein B296_00025801 [Ensete ventricosum]RZS16882.1 hypothetical protein BHM03_00048949 [Ensete ventricosum]
MGGEGSSMPSHDEETVASTFGTSGCGRRNPPSDRQTKWLHEWNRIFLLMCAAGLVVDPLFFYALSISSTCMCLFVDGWFAVTVTTLRCMTDAVHLLNMCLQLAITYDAAPRSSLEEKDASAGRAMAHSQSCSVGRSSCNAVPRNDVDGDDRLLDLVSLAVPPEGLSLGLLPSKRATECLKQQCVATDGCRNRTVACVDPMYYGTTGATIDGERLAWAKNLHVRSMCLDSSDNFEYGSYKWIVNLVTNPNRLEKVLFPIFWGLMTLRQRVRQYERQRWAAMRGVDEFEMARRLPEGMRRDIKYHLCLDLVRQVPLFQHMDELVLENICDRVKSLLIPKGETVSPCCVTHLPRSSSLLCARMMLLQLRPGHKRRRSSPKDAVRGEGPSPEQPSCARRREELLHAGTGELQRRRAPVVVPDPPVR